MILLLYYIWLFDVNQFWDNLFVVFSDKLLLTFKNSNICYLSEEVHWDLRRNRNFWSSHNGFGWWWRWVLLRMRSSQITGWYCHPKTIHDRNISQPKNHLFLGFSGKAFLNLSFGGQRLRHGMLMLKSKYGRPHGPFCYAKAGSDDEVLLFYSVFPWFWGDALSCFHWFKGLLFSIYY